MTEKEWLQRAWWIEQSIRDLERRKQKARQDLQRITPSYSYRGEQMTAAGNSREEKEFTLLEYIKKIEQEVENLYTVKLEIDNAIDKVSEVKLRRLLKLRYIDFKRWEQIADELGLKDVRWIYVLHKRALKKIGEALNLS